jgi:hypothetical protein
MHGNIEVARKHLIVNFSHESADARFSEGLVGISVAARFHNYKLAFDGILRQQVFHGLSLNQSELTASGANR